MKRVKIYIIKLLCKAGLINYNVTFSHTENIGNFRVLKPIVKWGVGRNKLSS